MSKPNVSTPESEVLSIDLRNPFLAGFLAWLLPGLGHYYQRRYPKAVIFCLCIAPTFFIGCVLGSSSEVGIARNVYWSWRSGDMRFWWLAQAPLGIAAIPSWTQAWQINAGQPPMLGRVMTPPKRFRDDPSGVSPTIDEIRQKLTYFELGTYLVVIACLMNILVVFDAIGGPFIDRRKEENVKIPPKEPEV